MSNKQFKICPICGFWNAPSGIECMTCGFDLANVKPVIKEKALNTQQSVQKTATEKGKICTECGHVNSPQARKCEKCKADLSDVRAVPVDKTKPGNDEAANVIRFEFVSYDGSFICDVPTEMKEMIVGRESFLSDYLSDKMYVSRQQAAIALNSENFIIRNLSRTNPTFVDNQELEPGKEYTFPYGKEIGLGGKVISGNRQKEAAYLMLRAKK